MTVLVATPPPKTELAQPLIEEALWRISVEQYHQMIDAGILTADDPIELLEGLLVEKMSKNPPHSVVTGLLQDLLRGVIPAGWYLNAQEPVTTRDSEPEPDLAIVRGKRVDYIIHHPRPKDTALVFEVADTTLRRDRGIKKRLYARAGIPIYWIVNLNQLQIEVYRQPDQTAAVPDYRQQQVYQGMDQVPVILDGIEIGQLLVSDVLPPQLAKQGEE